MDWGGLFRCDLSFRERLRRSWELTWPLVLIEAVLITVGYLIAGQGVVNLYQTYSIFAQILVNPFLVMRMMKLRYPGFRLKTLVDGEESEMSYTAGFKVGWLLSWRVLIPAIPVLLATSFVLSRLPVQIANLAPSTESSPVASLLSLSVLMALAGFVLMPLVIPGMFSKQYQGFNVAAERVTATAAAGAARNAQPPRRAKAR